MKFDHNNISPLDSRYAKKISNFRENFSESELIKIRFEIEIEWILFLCSKLQNTFKPLSKNSVEKIVKFKNSFDNKSVLQIKKIEATTNHDVKAVEYYIRNYFKKNKVLSSYIHLIHFGLTSEDVNSLSYAVIIKKGISIYVNEINNLNKVLNLYSKKWSNVAFLARTHGQPASPSTLGKEFKVFASRLDREISILKSIKPMAKFSGATGNYHTFDIVDTKIKWSSKDLLNQKETFNSIDRYTAEYVSEVFYADLLAGFSLFIAALILFFLASSIIASWIRNSRLNALDRSLGLLAGLVTSIVVLSLSVLVMDKVLKNRNYPPFVKTSKSVPAIRIFSHMLNENKHYMLPLLRYFHFLNTDHVV